MRGVFSGLFAEPFRKRRSSDLDDESVGSFLARRFNKNLANNLVSAVLHGIYAGDVDKLSAKSLFPGLWRGEQVYGSLARSLFGGRKEELLEDQLLRAELYRDNLDICARMGNASVYTFKKGIETLSLALARELEASPNVTIRTSYNVKGISFNVGQPFPVQVSSPSSPHIHPQTLDIEPINIHPGHPPNSPHPLHLLNIYPLRPKPCLSPPFLVSLPRSLRHLRCHCPRRKSLLLDSLPPSCQRLWLPYPEVRAPLSKPRKCPRCHLRFGHCRDQSPPRD